MRSIIFVSVAGEQSSVTFFASGLDEYFSY
jgi:hypothetical protein